MELSTIWLEIERFQEQGLATTASLHASDAEKQLVQQFLQRVPLEALFLALQDASNNGDAKRVKLCCGCIDRVLSGNANEGAFYEPEMQPFLLSGLKHVEKTARILTVNQLIAHLKSPPTIEQAKGLLNPDFLEEVCNAIEDEEVEVASKAATVLDLLARLGGDEFYKPVIDVLHSVAQDEDMEESSVEFMRYLEALTKISGQDDQRMQYAISSGAIEVILSCLKSSDTLFVMNVLDLIPLLCASAAGVLHIVESGTLQTLLTMAQDALIGDSALRLIGEISAFAAKHNIQSWNWSDPMLSKAFLSTIEAKMQSSDALQQIAAMDAITAFASSSVKELEVLLRHQQLCQNLLQLGASTTMTLKVNCFHMVARILGAATRLHKQPDQVPDENASIWPLNEKLFFALGAECRRPSTMTLLMECLRQPFDEIRNAVFTLMQAVAAQNHDWGMRALRSYGGFFEFLLDRSTEPTKETREWKFAVVDAILASRFHNTLDNTIVLKLRQHLQRGPYVGKSAAEMELEAA